MRKKRETLYYTRGQGQDSSRPWYYNMAYEQNRKLNELMNRRWKLKERTLYREQEQQPQQPQQQQQEEEGGEDQQEDYQDEATTRPTTLEDVYYYTSSVETTPSSITSERMPQHLHWWSWLNPMLLAFFASLIILSLVIFITKKMLHSKCSRSSQSVQAPSILVYPAQNGQAPQFLTKEINFSLPSPRSNSLTELCGTSPTGDMDEGLMLSRPQGRSNSFTTVYDFGAIDPSLYQDNFLDEDLLWPEGHVGRLWFSLKYENQNEKLLVTLVKAKNLPSRTVASINTCDPFVKLQLMPDERRTLQSKQKKKTCNPFFEETFVFHVSSKSLEELILKMTVMDGGKPKGRQTIGYITFPLVAIPMDENDEEPHLYKLDLEKDPQEPSSDLGEMLVSLLYNENLHRLSVTAIEGKRLKIKGERRSVYIRITMNQRYRAVKSKRSSSCAVAQDGSAAISECFHFRVPAHNLPLTCITIHVLQAGAKCSRDKVIGKFVLGSFMFARGKALEHWNSALANPMEQVQQWHSLSI